MNLRPRETPTKEKLSVNIQNIYTKNGILKLYNRNLGKTFQIDPIYFECKTNKGKRQTGIHYIYKE